MDLKAFELIETGLARRSFRSRASPRPSPWRTKRARLVMFSAADVAYGLLYDVKHQRFELRSTNPKGGRAARRLAQPVPVAV